MTVPHDFGISEDRASNSSTSSDIETPLDSFDHLLEFVITSVDQIDLAIYSALEPISKKVKKKEEITDIFKLWMYAVLY